VDIWSVDKLTLFIAFVLPGFISMQIYRLFIAGDDGDVVKNLPAIVSYSALHYLVFGWLLLISTGPWLTFWSYVVVLLLPIFWPFVILLIRDNAKWRKVFWPPRGLLAAMLKPEATPWDRVFTNRQRFVRITLKDGGFVGGFLADGSEVSTYPNDQQVFIRNEHLIDQQSGAFGAPIQSTGLLVNGTEIKVVEFIEVENGDQGDL